MYIVQCCMEKNYYSGTSNNVLNVHYYYAIRIMYYLRDTFLIQKLIQLVCNSNVYIIMILPHKDLYNATCSKSVKPTETKKFEENRSGSWSYMYVLFCFKCIPLPAITEPQSYGARARIRKQNLFFFIWYAHSGVFRGVSLPEHISHPPEHLSLLPFIESNSSTKSKYSSFRLVDFVTVIRYIPLL